MTKLMRFLMPALLLALSLFSEAAGAANYTLWINGRTGGGVIGDYTSFSYWGPGSANAGVNKKAVNWDGYNSIASQNYLIRNALDCFCTGDNWCYVATHSAGDLMMGYTLANYGGSTRTVTNATPDASGQCGAGGSGTGSGTTQTGWTIKWVRAAGGAAGGSELADYGSWAMSEPLAKDLKTTTARAMYDHNDTHDVWFYMYAGAKGAFYSGILPGQDDSAVAYHSTGGVSGAAGASYCNPGDWFCGGVLAMGTDANSDGSLKWAFHSVSFRDDSEAYNHYSNGNWEGIISQVLADMVAYAT